MTDYNLIYKKSRYKLLEESDDPIKKAFIKNNPDEFKSMAPSEELHLRSFETLTNALDRLGVNYNTLFRADLDQLDATKGLIVFGGDGSVIEATHHTDLPIAGVKPGNSVGFYCCYTADTIEEMFTNPQQTSLNKIKVSLNGDELPQQAINEVRFDYYSTGPGVSFFLDVNGVKTFNRSTYGLMVSTPQGSSGGISSLGGEVFPIGNNNLQYLPVGVNANPRYAREIKVISREEKGVFAIDPHWRHRFTLDDKITLEPGDTQIIIGDLREKQKKFMQPK